MLKRMLVVGALAVLVATALAGCSGVAPGTTSSSSGAAATASASAAFKLDAASTAPLAVAATGSGAAVRCGEATAAVYVPAGAAADGAVWTLTALAEAPAGVKKPLVTGVYVDTAKAPPSKPCVIGFAIPGKASKNATIVRIADDGASTQIVPTSRLDRGGRTLLTAAVDGFSAYTTSEEDKAAIDKAFADAAKAHGKQVDYTIKAGGSESQTYKGWKLDYDFDLFASGGGLEMGGVYKGHALLSVDGTYKGPTSIVKSWGTVTATARDQKVTFIIVDAPLVSLLTGQPEGEPIVGGTSAMHLKGIGTLDMQARGPTAKGGVTKNVNGADAVPFVIVIKGDDVQVEIPMVGIFPGKILRTTK